MNKLLVICGPTASGKTALAAVLAKKFHGELVSADSRQVYRGLDIGTGKDRQTIGEVSIWMYDVVAPDEEFSVSQYVTLARGAIADITKRGKLPIVVGGTGLYIQALLRPFETINIPPDKDLRKKLRRASVRALQTMLSPDVLRAMNQSDGQNPRRLIRKIEIAQATRKRKPTLPPEFDDFIVGLTAPMPILYKRIDERVNARMRQGMAEEVSALVKKYGDDIPALSALGYRSLEHWSRDEHAYARRQMTWFRRQKDIHWFDGTDSMTAARVEQAVRAWYTG